MTFTRSQRLTIIVAALLALFLGALDALIISAAMPTVVADLGGLHRYSWVFSAYFLSRAVSLPIAGKLADIYPTRNLLIVAIGVFLVSSMAAGCAWNMTALIVSRIVQGIGAGGIFALVYVVLADVSVPENRGRTLSLASVTWGIASVLGPTLGGFIVTYFSWRWIFFINVPLGLACLWGIGVHLKETRRRKAQVSLDLLGATILSATILAFLILLMTGGRTYPWLSPQAAGLLMTSIIGLTAFIMVEKRAADPILSMGFFKNPSFSMSNGAIFLSSFSIFSLFAFAPLFIQGVQGRQPLQVGIAMLSLSLGWSLGSMALGQFIDRMGRKPCALVGALGLIIGSAMTLTFTGQSTLFYSFCSFFIVGVGMGFVSLSTLMVVQAGLQPQDLGVATSSNQFARTMGGAVGVGFCGGLIAKRFTDLAPAIENAGLLQHLPTHLTENGMAEVGQLLRPEVQAMIPPDLKLLVQESVAAGVNDVFISVTLSAVGCLLLCMLLPTEAPPNAKSQADNPQ